MRLMWCCQFPLILHRLDLRAQAGGGERSGAPGSEADVDEAVALAARSLTKAGAVVENISIPAHAEALTVMFAGSVDGTLSTWSDQGPAGPNPGGYHPLSAIRFFQEARKSRAADLPDMAKTVMLFAHVMRARYGNYYSAKAQNLLRPIRAAYDEALKNCDLLIMPTTVMKAHPIPSADASREEILGMTLDMLGNTAPFDGTAPARQARRSPSSSVASVFRPAIFRRWRMSSSVTPRAPSARIVTISTLPNRAC